MQNKQTRLRVLCLAFLAPFYLFGLLVCFCALAESAAADEVKDFTVIATLDKEGTLAVEETIRVNFTEPDKHGLLRKIPLDFASNAANLSIQAVQCPPGIDAEFQKSELNKSYQIKIGNKYKKVSGNKAYFIKYTLANIFDKAGKTNWSPNGKNWQMPIDHMTVKIKSEGTSVPIIAPVSSHNSQPKTAVQKQKGSVSFETGRLEPGQALRLSLTGIPQKDGYKKSAPVISNNDTIWCLAFILIVTVFLCAALRNMTRPRSYGGGYNTDNSYSNYNSSYDSYSNYNHYSDYHSSDWSSSSGSSGWSSSDWSSSSDSSSSDSGSSGGGDSW